jgi:hypothetical protein
MPPAPAMTFPFQELSDAKGLTTFRPVIPLRPMSAPLGHSERCLVDTGSPNTYLDWRLAPLAGVGLSQAETIPDPQEWSVGGVAAEQLWGATAAFMIPEERHMIWLVLQPDFVTFIAGGLAAGNGRF